MAPFSLQEGPPMPPNKHFLEQPHISLIENQITKSNKSGN
jgi:hypothetical protein